MFTVTFDILEPDVFKVLSTNSNENVPRTNVARNLWKCAIDKYML